MPVNGKDEEARPSPRHHKQHRDQSGDADPAHPDRRVDRENSRLQVAAGQPPDATGDRRIEGPNDEVSGVKRRNLRRRNFAQTGIETAIEFVQLLGRVGRSPGPDDIHQDPANPQQGRDPDQMAQKAYARRQA
jgi:hypothetical protein